MALFGTVFAIIINLLNSFYVFLFLWNCKLKFAYTYKKHKEKTR